MNLFGSDDLFDRGVHGNSEGREQDDAIGPASRPLADRMRPTDLDEFVGQRPIVGPGTALRRSIERDELRSIVLWGPPGCGKTTLARIVARRTQAAFIPFSAVLSGIKEVRQVMEQASRLHRQSGKRTILFVDEIHRFNKAQQDAFLPYVEEGTVALIGATTENPSFEINAALLSRSRVYRMERLTSEELRDLLVRALADPERGLGKRDVEVPDELLEPIIAQSQGDARTALNLLEFVVDTASDAETPGQSTVTRELLTDALQKAALYYDKAGEAHFNLISALHKSMRNSDPDASLYWLARMLDAGEDPMYIARRIVRFASEDVGLADPRALGIAVAARDALHLIGVPEGELALAQATLFCALAPKSNAIYRAWKEIRRAIADGATDPVPLQLRNATTGLMKREGYGKGYRYAHDSPDAVTDMECLPPSLVGRQFYRPTSRGFERTLDEKLRLWRSRRSQKATD